MMNAVNTNLTRPIFTEGSILGSCSQMLMDLVNKVTEVFMSVLRTILPCFFNAKPIEPARVTSQSEIQVPTPAPQRAPGQEEPQDNRLVEEPQQPQQTQQPLLVEEPQQPQQTQQPLLVEEPQQPQQSQQQQGGELIEEPPGLNHGRGRLIDSQLRGKNLSGNNRRRQSYENSAQPGNRGNGSGGGKNGAGRKGRKGRN